MTLVLLNSKNQSATELKAILATELPPQERFFPLPGESVAADQGPLSNYQRSPVESDPSKESGDHIKEGAELHDLPADEHRGWYPQI